MAKNYDLTWNQKQKRWSVKFNLKQHFRSPKQLGLPRDKWTKEHSYAAALAWWTTKKAELEQAGTPQSVYASALDREPHLKTLIDDHNKTIRAIKRTGIDVEQLSTQERLKLHKMVFEKRDIIQENTIDTTKALMHHVNAYRLKAQQDTENGIIKPGRYNKIDNSLKWFAKFAMEKEFETVEVLDAGCLESYFGWLNKKFKVDKVLACATSRDHWQVFHVWVQWLAEHLVIPMPLNINNKKFRFDCPKVKYRYWTKKEFQAVYKPAHDRLKLYLLLVANCGFYASDIGSLKKSEIDLKKGTITRQRTKTGEDLDLEKYEPSTNVPVTTYHLWPETLKLLKSQLSAEIEYLALTNEDGGPLWKDGVYPEGHKKAGNYWKTNNILSVYSRFCVAHKIENPPTFEMLRKTSAQFLSDSDFQDCADKFGGWAAKTTRTKHYTEITDARFKKAVLWLRGCYL